MSVDSTAVGILAGAVISAGLAIWQALRHKSVDPVGVALNFLAVFGALAAVTLIWAAFRGDPSDLPNAWREYLATAGVIGIGLALQHLVKTVHAIRRPPTKAALLAKTGSKGTVDNGTETAGQLHEE